MSSKFRYPFQTRMPGVSDELTQQLAANFRQMDGLFLPKPPTGTAAGSIPTVGADGTVSWQPGTRRMKVGSLSVPGATGAQAITGLGFKPSLLMFDVGWTLLTTESIGGRGQADASGNQNWSSWHIQSAARYSNGGTTRCIVLISASAGNPVLIEANFNSFDADGFTLGWINVNASGLVRWTAFA